MYVFSLSSLLLEVFQRQHWWNIIWESMGFPEHVDNFLNCLSLVFLRGFKAVDLNVVWGNSHVATKYCYKYTTSVDIQKYTVYRALQSFIQTQSQYD